MDHQTNPELVDLSKDEIVDAIIVEDDEPTVDIASMLSKARIIQIACTGAYLALGVARLFVDSRRVTLVGGLAALLLCLASLFRATVLSMYCWIDDEASDDDAVGQWIATIVGAFLTVLVMVGLALSQFSVS